MVARSAWGDLGARIHFHLRKEDHNTNMRRLKVLHEVQR